jgi:hypothetical protein
MRILPILAGAILAAPSVAQVFQFSVDPWSTYLRTVNDAPMPPLVVALSAIGVGPGQWLRVASTGDYAFAAGQPDNYRTLIGAFSSSATVLPETGFPHRLPDAVAAGPHIPTGASLFGGQPTDLPEDFVISHPLWTDHVFVEVPPNATHLIVGTLDSYFGDNNDPDGDFGLVVTLLAPPPPLPGTGEHLVLRSGIGAPTTSGGSVHTAPAGATMAVEMEYLTGMISGSLYVFVADAVPTGVPVQPLLPRLWMQNLTIVHWGVLVSTPLLTDSWSLVAPPGLVGTSLLVQAGALAQTARNGIYLTTDAHEFRLQ